MKAGRTDGAVEIAVSDTGIGIAHEDQVLDGRMWVESAPGRGSTFTFTLPVS